MKIDRYTKIVLTVIAACLVWISLGGPSLVRPVHAATIESSVYIAGWIDGDGNQHKMGPANSYATAPGLPVYITKK